jgi:hypothetical protein
MIETLEKNRFTDLGGERVYYKDNIVVYKTNNINTVDALNGKGWCPNEPGMKNYIGPLYVIVKILPNGIKIKGGMDTGYGTLRYINDKTMTMEDAKKYIDIIDTVYTDEVLMNITPKMKNKKYILPDMWLLRKLNNRINTVIRKNKNIIELLLKQKVDNFT